MCDWPHGDICDVEDNSKDEIIRGCDSSTPKDVIHTVEGRSSIEKGELNKYFDLETLFTPFFEKINAKRDDYEQ